MPYNQIPLELRLHPDFRSEILPKILSGECDCNDEKVHRMIDENREFYEKVDFRNVVKRIQEITGDLPKHIINREEITQQSIQAVFHS